jgi:lipoteichoic acid synthase
LYPLGRGAVFFTHTNNEYNSIQKLLKKRNNYYSATFHANNASFWNRDIMYNSFGVDKFYDIESYDVGEENSVGWGLKDKDFFSRSVDLMTDMPKPFYSYFITLTNHFPFELGEEDKLIEEFDSNSGTLNRYFPTVRYQDEALKLFIEKLKASGLYENSIIVIMGDHYGISENHNKAMATYLGKEEITPYDSVQLQRVPFLIHIPGITDKDPRLISTISAQVDVKPTLLHLLGIETKDQIHFGNDLLSEDRIPFTILRNSDFVTKDFLFASGVCYDRESGIPMEEVDACKDYEIKAHRELTYSDKIIYGDLLRFYEDDLE